MTGIRSTNIERGPREGVSRLPGAVIILASATMITGAAIGFLAPSLRDAPPFVTDDLARVATAIAGNPTAWAWANSLIFAAAILTTMALVPVSLWFVGPSRPWALAGLVTFALAAAAELVYRLITIDVTTWAAERYPEETAVLVWEAFDSIRLHRTFYVLAFVALGLYGIAVTRSGAPSPGWAFVGVMVIGITIEVLGAGIPVYVYLATAAFAVTTWQIHIQQGETENPG